MSTEPKVRFYLGANAPTGFYSLYDQLIDPAEAEDVLILKGGPGCGKSTLMKAVAQKAEEQGLLVEYIPCSGDPDSLDAIILPQRKTAIVDGTAPHAGRTKDNKGSGGLRHSAFLPTIVRFMGLVRWYNRHYKGKRERPQIRTLVSECRGV